MNISHSPSRSLHCLNPATITSALFAVSVPTLTFTPPQHASPHLLNQLATSLRIPHPNIIIHAPLSANIIWTCRFNLLNSKLCYHLPSLFHCFTLSSKLKNYLFRKSYPPPLSVSVCQSHLMALDRLMDLLAYRFLCFSSIFLCIVIQMCGRQSCPTLWSTLGAQ